MLSVSELKEACEFMERAYAISMLRDNDGDLYITNHNYKNNK